MFGNLIPVKYPFLRSVLKSNVNGVGSAVYASATPVQRQGQSLQIPSIPDPSYVNNYTLAKTFLPLRDFHLSSGIGVPLQVRHAHTDIDKPGCPSFDAYRRPSRMDPKKKTDRETEAGGKNFTYLITAAGGVGGVYAAKNMVLTFVQSMGARADTLDMSTIEIKLGSIPEGTGVTFKWRGKPLFIRHRTAKEIKAERDTDHTKLRDPQTDDERIQRPEWLVVIGVCTHLGCVPITHAGSWGGYFCPCHGSHYDASGRIRQGPAPLNLEVPAYTFIDDGTLVVG